MKKIEIKDISNPNLSSILKRPVINYNTLYGSVKPIMDDVKTGGLTSALKYANKLDNFDSGQILVSEEELNLAGDNLTTDLKSAIAGSKKNIEKFHSLQKPKNYEIEITAGVKCYRQFRPIESVGLYIPGGSAVLPSTLLMLAVPAIIAGCGRIVCLSPVKGSEMNEALLYAAKICNISEFYKIGGVHGISLLGYGDKNIPKVDKIFGPGNQYVNAAKHLISFDPEGCAVDMPAGPSELLVIADNNSNPRYVAADLISQAEHGIDSQVVLITFSEKYTNLVFNEIESQSLSLPRKEIVAKALENSVCLIVDNMDTAIYISNQYAPEHLILNVDNASSFKNKIINAGSVFIGPFAPESAGDYSSGTNHSLPTGGFAKSFGGLCVEDFMKPITFQQLSRKGLKFSLFTNYSICGG